MNRSPFQQSGCTVQQRSRPPSSTGLALVALALCYTGSACHPLQESLRAPLFSKDLDSNTAQSNKEFSLPSFSNTTQTPQTAPPKPSDGFELVVDNRDRTHKAPEPRVLEKAEYVLLGIDCFGGLGEQTCGDLSKLAGLDPGQKLRFGWYDQQAARLIQKRGSYAKVNLSPVFFPDGSAYVTIDIVSQRAARQTTTRTTPQNHIPIPSNILETYVEFSHVWADLFHKGVSVRKTSDKGYWEYHHDGLAPYVSLFRNEGPRYRQGLIQVLREDGAMWKRHAAAGLLGFDASNPLTANALTFALSDPSSNVRSEAARALLPRAQRDAHQGTTLLDAGSILQMLSLPTPADRSGASALLAELAQIPALRKNIRGQAWPTLLQMLAATRPGARAHAIEILERTTGLSHGDDLEKWKRVKRK